MKHPDDKPGITMNTIEKAMQRLKSSSQEKEVDTTVEEKIPEQQASSLKTVNSSYDKLLRTGFR